MELSGKLDIDDDELMVFGCLFIRQLLILEFGLIVLMVEHGLVLNEQELLNLLLMIV